MAQTPSCCDNELDLIRKILLQLQSTAVGLDPALLPSANDGPYELYRKILLTLPFI